MARPRVAKENLKGLSAGSKRRAARGCVSALEVGGKGEPITPPPEVVGDPVAAERWAWIIESHRLAGYTPCKADIQIMARLCLVYSDLAALRVKEAAAVDEATYISLHRLTDSGRRIALTLEDKLLLTVSARQKNIPVKVEKVIPANIKDIAGRL